MNFEKVMRDLESGYRLTFIGGGISWVEVVTRWNKDLFVVQALHSEIGADDVRFSVSRRNKVPKQLGVCSLESWSVDGHPMVSETRTPHFSEWNNALPQPEFWRRYNASTVDLKASRDMVDFYHKTMGKHAPIEIKWLAEESSRITR